MKSFPVGRFFMSTWLVYLFHFRHLAAGSDRFVLLVRAIAEQGTFQLDAYQNSLYFGDVVQAQGHYYSNINPGTAWLGVPFWAIAHFFYQFIPATSPLRTEALHHFLAHLVAMAFSSSVLSALASAMLAAFIYRRTHSLGRSFLVGFLYSFCSIAFFYSTRLSQNILIAALTIFLFILQFEPSLFKIKNHKIQLILLGFISGLGFVIDFTIVPVSFILVLTLGWQYRQSWQSLVFWLYGVIPPLVMLLLYQWICFGNPLISASSLFIAQDAISEPQISLFVNLLQRIKTLFIYGFSPKAGLFIYMPYLALSIFYLVKNWQNSFLLKKPEKWFIVGVCLTFSLFLLVLPPSYLQYTLFGCRYIIPIIPLLCIPFALYFRHHEYQLGFILIALGFLMNLAGAQQGYDTGNIIVYTFIYIFRGAWFPILDWLKTGLPEGLNILPNILNPGGILGILFLSLGVIWLPYYLEMKTRRM